jgi:hypothetical protein
MPTWCASQEPKKLFSPLLAAIHSEPSPTSPSALPPFSGAKLPIGLGLVGLFSGMPRDRSTTRLPKLLDPTSLLATVLLAAPHEAAEARWSDLPLSFVPSQVTAI